MSFGTGGIVTTQLINNGGSEAFALAVQPADQKIVAGGDVQPNGSDSAAFGLVRYNTDGTLDSTFGSGGVVTTVFSTSDFSDVNSILIQPNDGKILAGGTDIYFDKKTLSYPGRFALARYTASGSLDNSFGTGGKVTTSFPASDYQAVINTLLLRSDGEIVAVGDVSANSLNNFASVALAVYKSNGALDKSFGSSGTVVDSSLTTSTTNSNPGGGTTTVYKYFTASGGALESDNSVLVAGSYVTETKVTTKSGSVSWTLNERDLALVHYLANGQRDLTFGSAGIAVTPITPAGVTTSNAGGTNVVIQTDGAIVVVGTAAGSSGYTDFVVARYNSIGTLDGSFGGGGYALTDLGAAASGDSVVLQPNGQIVAAGLVATSLNQYGTPLTWGFATERLNIDGSLDTSFGTGGAVVTAVLYDDNYSVAVGLETINSQTMIVDAGTAGNSVFGLVRYTPNGSLDSGGSEPAIAAFRGSASPTTTVSMVTISHGSLADSSPISPATDAVESVSDDMMIPGSGLVLQALESPDFLDTLLPGRRRR